MCARARSNIVSAFKIPSAHYCLYCLESINADNARRGSPRAYTSRRTFGPPGRKRLRLCPRETVYTRTTQVFPNDIETVPRHCHAVVLPLLLLLVRRLFNPFLFYLFFYRSVLYYYFFSRVRVCLLLFRRLHSSRKHLLRFPNGNNNATAARRRLVRSRRRRPQWDRLNADKRRSSTRHNGGGAYAYFA